MKFIILLLISLASLAYAEIRPAAIFGDHMVLQREMPVPVWGTATAQARVSVSFGGQKKETQADSEGRWKIELDPFAASAIPRELRIESSLDPQPVVFNDVLVGEVWLGSGQSNMQIPIKDMIRWKKKDLIRDQQMTNSYPLLRQWQADEKNKGPWNVATSDNIKEFSALLFPFGLELHQQLEVPVGLILCAVGGSPSGRWLSKEMYSQDPGCSADLKTYEASYPRLMADFQRRKQLWDKSVAEGKQTGKEPQPPREVGHAGFDIGDFYEDLVRPVIPYAIRAVIWDQGEADTGIAGVGQHALLRALISGWREAWGRSSSDMPFLYMQKPSGGGCAWDPLDPMHSNADAFKPAAKPASQMSPNKMRLLYPQMMDIPNTTMITAMDLGGDTHPENKSAYGKRSTRVALGSVYDRPIEVLGPLYASHSVEGGKMKVSFTHVGQGLTYRHGESLQGFAIAGRDGVFHWAEALIDGENVVLWCKEVPDPINIRYAWGYDISMANLFNKDGLPALPFATN